MEIWKRKLVNTNKFRVPALRFKDYGGYCNSPEGTTSYFEYWDKESRRCIYGDYFDGDYISGYNYYYLNYSPILLVREKVDSTTGKVSYERVVDFPDFWDFDYFYFNYLDESEKLGKHAAVIKTRGRGYSFKGGSMLARNFSLIPGSKSYAVASGQEYLTKDGILSKCWDVLSFMDEHTAWGKRKHRKDLPMHKRASYLENVNGKLTEKGYKSEVIGITLGNDTHKARGKRGKLMLWEESGSNSRLLDAWNIARPSFEQNRQTFGLMVAFGTGGDDGNGFTGLRELFNNTDGYNIHGIDNIFEPGSGNTKVGFFVPESSNYRSDVDGNSLVEESLVLIEDDRAKIRNNAKSKRTYDQYVAEHPLTPSEALLRVKGNIFPLTDLLEHLSWLEGNDTANTFGNKGSLVFDDSGKLAWIPQPHGVYIKDFPLNGDYDADTSIMVWEHPVDNTPNGLYVCGCLLPGEKVLTDSGLKSIETVTMEDKLINKEGDIVDIINLQTREKVEHDVFKVKLSNSFRTTTFTSEHPIYVSKSGYNSNKTLNEDLFNFDFKRTDEIVEGDWIKYPNIYTKEIYYDHVKLWNDYLVNNCQESINPLLEKDFWWFVGLWLGDGYCYDKTGSVNISFNKAEEYYIAKAKDVIVKLFDRSPSYRERGNSVEISFNHRQFTNFLTTNFGAYADGKYVSEWVKYINVEYKKSLLLGYLASDGCITFHTNGYYSTEFVSVSLELLEGVQDILFSLGVVSNLSKLRDAKKSTIKGREVNIKDTYHLRFGHNDSILFKSLIDDKNDLKLKKMNSLNCKETRTRGKNGCFISNDGKYIYFQIKSIESFKYTGLVYNFECDTNTFLSRYITTHNCDPYDHDKSSSGSLGSLFVYKRFHDFDGTYNCLVAEYTARPNAGADAFYENCRRIALYYNAKILYENQVKGMHTYFKHKNSEFLLADTPTFLKDVTKVKDSVSLSRGKGIHMPKQIKDFLEGKTRDWMLEEVSDGKLNLHMIYSIPLLRELIAYDGEINTDRVIAFFLCIAQNIEMQNVHVRKKEDYIKDNDFFARVHFRDKIRENYFGR